MPADTNYAEEAAAARAQFGAWIPLRRDTNSAALRNQAMRIRNGQAMAFRPVRHYEAKVTPQPDGSYVLHVRCVRPVPADWIFHPVASGAAPESEAP